MKTKQEINSKRPDFQASVEAQWIYKRLASAAVGDVVTYVELSEIAGYDVQGNRSAMETARRMMQREGVVFGVIHNEGLRRLDEVEKVNTGLSALRWIRNKSRRAVRRIVCADFEALPNEMKVRHNALLAQFGVLGMFSKERALRRLETATEEKQNRLRNAEVLKRFAGNGTSVSK